MVVRNVLRRWFLALAAALLLAAPAVTLAGFDRVGPTMSDVGYPQWYQDHTGLTFEFCSITNVEELAGGWCLLLPADTTFPESFPGAFADEHFYWAADAIGDWSLGGASSNAALVLGLEAAFAVTPTPGGQLVFGRLRIRVDDLPLNGTYTVYTPFGKYEFPGQVAGQRLFFTEDIGINCAPGNFECALQSSVGPFLVASNTPGGAELPPVTGPAPGKLYVADPGRIGPVTGSILPDYVLANGQALNPNVFRIEGPGGVLMLETHDFALMGRLFAGEMPGKVTIDRASYARTATAQQVDVFATALPTRNARVPAAPQVAPVVPALSAYMAPCGGVVSPDGDVLPPFTAPVGFGIVPMASNGSTYWVQGSPLAIPTGICVAHTNAQNTSGVITPVYVPAPVGDQVFISEATYDPDLGSLVVSAISSDAVAPPILTLGGFGDVPNTDLDLTGTIVIPTLAPPAKVRVLSSEHGANEMQVTAVSSSAVANQPPVAVADSAETLAGQLVSIAVLENDTDADNDALVVSSVTQPVNGTVTFTATAAVYTPTVGFLGADAFTYTVTDGRGGFSTTSVSVTVATATNVAPTANPDAASIGVNTGPVTVQVLANDSDANGDAMFVSDVTQPASGVVTFDGVSVTYTPVAGFTGIVTFNYTVSDGQGGSSPGLVTITVRPAEILTITLAQFRVPNEWRVSGTSTANGATITIHAGSTLAGPTIGTATVAGGLWTFRSSTTGVPSNTRISVESTGGAVRLNQAVTIR